MIFSLLLGPSLAAAYGQADTLWLCAAAQSLVPSIAVLPLSLLLATVLQLPMLPASIFLVVQKPADSARLKLYTILYDTILCAMILYYLCDIILYYFILYILYLL